MANGGWKKAARLWGLPDGALIKTLAEHGDGVTRLVISPDGRLLASGGWNEELRLWSLPDGEFIKTLAGHGAGVTGLAFSPDGRLLASGGMNGTVRIWTLPLIRLCHLPVVMASQDDFELVQETLREGKVAESARPGLEFIAALMLRQKRFDIAIEEPRPRIEVGDFDIEIAG
jgi:WD40 repeat protein